MNPVGKGSLLTTAIILLASAMTWSQQAPAEYQQVRIGAYLMEINAKDDLLGAVDWFNSWRGGASTFPLSGNLGGPGDAILSTPFGGVFFKAGFILPLPAVQANIRNLSQQGKVLLSMTSPVTYTRPGDPVQIESTTDQRIFLPATANAHNSTVPYFFTTGLTVAVLPVILPDGIVDLKVNLTLSSQTGTSPAQPGTTTTVPIISVRSAATDVAIQSGQAAVIGGITRNNSSTNGIPGLGKSPLLGKLFAPLQKKGDYTNLIIVLCPQIIQGS
jgi:type II secretory pathway component GspD/PulD (secretin)